MTVGQRIKLIRTFRNMTQAELGAALGFHDKNQAVRIAQYESNYRVPKTELLMEMAAVLKCNYKALSSHNTELPERIMETLFWLEESDPDCIKLFEMTPASPNTSAKMTYNGQEYPSSCSPVAITLNYGLVNDFLLDWTKKKAELQSGAIDAKEYFEWKITWPQY